MSNYTQTTFFAPKDALLSGDPNKIIHGTQVDPELAAIAVAIASKFDVLNMGSIVQFAIGSGTVGAPSHSFGADTTTGLYLSAVGTTYISAAGVNQAGFGGGVVIGTPTGGFKGTGTINAGAIYLNGVALGVSTGSANPSATIGLSAVNGTATTFMTSDSAPPLSQAISPTWTGNHTFAATSGVAVTITPFAGQRGLVVGGSANSYVAEFDGSAISGQSFGVYIRAGTTSADTVLRVDNHAATGTFLDIFGDGHGQLGQGAGAGTGLTWSASGNFAIGAPGSGTALQVNVLDGTVGVDFQGGPGTAGYYQRWASNSGAVRGYIGIGAALFGGGAVTDFGISTGSIAGSTLRLAVNGTFALSIASTGAVTISAPTSGAALTVNGVSPSSAINTNGPFFVANYAGSTNLFGVTGNTTSPTVEGYGPTAAGLVDMTPDTGTFTMTYTGFTGSGTATWSRIGKLVFLNFPASTGASSSTAFTATGLPAAIQPATLTQLLGIPANAVEDNSTKQGGTVAVSVASGSGTLTLLINGNAAGWTNGGNKGVVTSFTVGYLLN